MEEHAKKKTVATFSSERLTSHMEPKMRRLGVATNKQVRFLGCDYAAGGKVRRPIFSKHLGKRLERYQRSEMMLSEYKYN